VRARLLLILLLLARGASADTIVLAGGGLIEADRTWYEGGELRYRRGGDVFGVPRQLVERVDPGPSGVILVDPDVLRSRSSLANGDPSEALRFARLALFRAPASVDALHALASAQLALGHASRAKESAERALSLDASVSLSHELLGDALKALGDDEAARAAYRAALEKGGSPDVDRKLEGLDPLSPSLSSARFRLRYDGAADQPLGLRILAVLDGAWEEYERRLGFTPGLPVTVVLETTHGFRDTTRAPEWVAAWNDGTIRVPVQGLDRPTPRLVRVLRHELAHSFVASKTGPNCPTWLHEGVAQWLEGGDPAREDVGLAPLARSGRLTALTVLEAPFVGLGATAAATAYAESLSVVAHMLRLRGEASLLALIAALGEGVTLAEAVPRALPMDYAGLQRSWQAHLKGVDRASSRAAAER
jgi:tetratricopeptide (TPR) repeat protein